MENTEIVLTPVKSPWRINRECTQSIGEDKIYTLLRSKLTISKSIRNLGNLT